ncbi:molybdopterin molybdotransferase MoeA [Clostridium bowmanii]|uniref:molybdopterin molybdotransferase MoeA n=1 Tax=Clostridium bowmanii TaxID=132925 RepID=UPI001C0DEC2B|nr:molybdopterin molybdotransferase MoeA [Clostridium bowmanii]MBU3190804.1 molybdopterin molybdotransferase MoeA [Clostridium bowmanii]MCA1075292.1 molybdopterin molybdotransferase MoeA [Clostridium bowmanii]
MELFNVVSVKEAKGIIDSSFTHTLGCEKINILQSASRISFSDIKAECNIPEFKRSTVDGYAVSSRDVNGASESMPSMLELKGEVLMGKVPPSDIALGECMYVPTGGMLPGSADGAVMIEYTHEMDADSHEMDADSHEMDADSHEMDADSHEMDADTILIYSPVAMGENVIQVGEDISAGDIVIKKGDKLRPYEIGVLASIGISEVTVYKRPRVAIISTGDEVVPCEAKPSIGQVRDINTHLIWSLLLEDGMQPVSYGIIKDEYNDLKNTVDRAFNECDMVLISGGSSVGKKDQTLKVISSYDDGEILVHGIAVKPGKPTIIGKHSEKIIFGLPGHPLACSIVYKVLVKEYLYGLTSQSEKIYGTNAVMSINYHSAKGREEYLPVELETMGNVVVAKPVFGKSGLISVFSKAWGYVVIDKNVEGLKEGQIVQVYKL